VKPEGMASQSQLQRLWFRCLILEAFWPNATTPCCLSHTNTI